MSRAASARRWGARAEVLVRRAVDRSADAAGGARRALWRRTGLTTLPDAVWDAPPTPSPGRGAAERSTAHPTAKPPLPAPAAVQRWLTGSRRPSLDAWAPRGLVAAGAPGLLLLPVSRQHAGPESAWSWTPADAVQAAAALAAAADAAHEVPAGSGGKVVLLGVPDEDSFGLRAVRRALRGHPRAVRRRVLVVNGLGVASDHDSPAGRRMGAVLSAVDAVALPPGLRPSPAAADRFNAAGRPAVELDVAALSAGRALPPSATDLATAGRRARLDLVRRAGTGPAAPVTALCAVVARVVHEPRRVVVAGHDLKFAAPLVAELRARGHEVREDRWQGHARHRLEASRALAAWADTVHCEWTLGNAVWYSRHLLAVTRLTTRTHLQENATVFPRRVRVEAVDAWVSVAEHVRAQLVRDAGVPAERALVVPNGIVLPDDGVTAAGGDGTRRHVLGLVGVLPERKGLHRALDLLAALRVEDPRFTLRIRGRRPEELGWVATRPEAAAYYMEQVRRVKADPLLAGAVGWDPHGPDMGAWYSRVGVALSVSDFESFHFTLPDGAVHGAVPRSLAWAGADRLYPAHWLAADLAELAASVRAVTADARRWREAAGEAHDFVAGHYAADRVTPVLADVVLGVR